MVTPAEPNLIEASGRTLLFPRDYEVFVKVGQP
jgi:hypothetical protein